MKLIKRWVKYNSVFFSTNMRVIFLKSGMLQNNRIMIKMANIKIKIILFIFIK